MGNELRVSESQQLQVQVDVANKYPRNLSTFVSNVFAVVQRDQEFAMSCIYCVPVGKTDGVQKFELGPSVRLSEEMQKYWKHLRIAVNCDLQQDKIVCTGLIMDCENNNAETLTEIVSVKGWNPRRTELKVKAMQSCMKRDLRLSIMGKSYANELIENILNDLLPDEVESWEFCKNKYAEIGVTEETILKYFKVDKAEELSKRNIYMAMGIYNFLKDQGEDGSYVFGDSGAKAPSRPQVTPDMVKVEPVQEQSAKNTAAPGKKSSSPGKNQKPSEVMDDSEFVKTAMPLIVKMGYDENSISSVLEAELSITGGIHNVPADMQSVVIDLLTSMGGV